MGCINSSSASNPVEDIVVTGNTGGGVADSSRVHRAAAGRARSLHVGLAAAGSMAEANPTDPHGTASATGDTLEQLHARQVRMYPGAVGEGRRWQQRPGTTAVVSTASNGMRQLLVLDHVPQHRGRVNYAFEPAPEYLPSQVGFIGPRSSLASPDFAHFMMQYRDLSPEDFELLSKLDEGVPRRGTASASFVEGLPKVNADSCDSLECGVCLGAVTADSEVVRLQCRHNFHPECISKWLTEFRSTCPLCTAPVRGDKDGDA